MSRESCALSHFSLQSIALLNLPIILSRIWQLISPPFFGSASPCQWQTHTRVPRQLWKKNLTTRNLSCARGNVEMWKLIRAIWHRWVTHARAVSALATCLKSIYGIVSHSIYRISWPQTCDFTSTATLAFGFASVHWRQVHRSYDFPLTEVCVACMCACVSHVCPGRVAYREITFIIGTQPAKRNCQIEKENRTKSNRKQGKRTEQKESL